MMQPAQHEVPGHPLGDAQMSAAGITAAAQSALAGGGFSSAIERLPIVDRATWLQWRMADVTASDVSALFSAHPYGKTRLSLWADKQGLTEGLEDSDVLRRGRWGEAAVLEMLAEERPTWKIIRPRVYLRDRSIRLGGTPDAEAVDPERDGLGIIQTKTVAESVHSREWIGGAPPLGHQLQTLSEMMLAGASWGAVAALVMGRFGWEPVIFDLERNEAAEARIRAGVVQFWNDFEAGLMPVLDPELDAETVKAIYPRAEIKDPPVDLTGDNELSGMLMTRATLQRLAKDAAKQIEKLETTVKMKLGVHERATAPGWRISWRNEPRKGHVVEASNPRVLRISEETANG
jgi:predicted phage-related endonuclease